MSHPPSQPLTPEERALADMLARDRAVGGPPPALDASILAAARAGAGATPRDAAPRAPAPRQRRALRAFGIAASVVLAVGVAWQLRPGAAPELLEYSEAPVSAVASRVASDAADAARPERQEVVDPRAGESLRRARQAPAGAADGLPDRRDAGGDLPPPAATPPARDAAPAAAAKVQAIAEVPATPPPAPAIAIEPAPEAHAPAAYAPPPPPPPPADATSDAAAPGQRDAERTRDLRRAQRTVAPAPATEVARRAAAEAAARGEREDTSDIVFDATTFDQPFDDQPPASADSPDVQHAWLARIGELVNEEQYDAARASLAEFRRRYPDAPLPDGLRRLLE